MPFSSGTNTTITGNVNLAEPITVDGAVTVTGAVETDRKPTTVTLTIAQGAALSGALDMRDYAGGIVIMPANWTTADLGVKVCDTIDGTFVPLLDSLNGYGTDVSVDAAAAAKAYPLPPWVFAAHYVKLWSHNGSGADVNQESARTFVIMLKS